MVAISANETPNSFAISVNAVLLLASGWVGDVEVVILRLRTGDEGAVSERGPHVALALREKLEILADIDDLGGDIQRSTEILDDCRPESYLRCSSGT